MTANQDVKAKTKLLNDFSMAYETAVRSLPSDHYLEAFCEFFEIKNRDLKLIPSSYGGFYETLREVAGYDVWQPIAEKTESLFGLPKRVTVFENCSDLLSELEGPDGLAPFFFVFDLMFCEYENFVLCFISGTNN